MKPSFVVLCTPLVAGLVLAMRKLIGFRKQPKQPDLEKTTMERKNWLLLTICAAGEKGLTPVQLQKSLFVLQKGFPRKVGRTFYKFVAYNYGPFCVEIYGDAESLQAVGLIEMRRGGRRWPEYHGTPTGILEADKLRRQIPLQISQYIDHVVEWTQAQSFPSLVRSIYEAYPEFKAHSVFRG